MNPGGPNLGPSSVLDRVKMFLPQMAQANLELEKQISGEGSDSVVIDRTILADEDDSDDEEDEDEDEKDTKDAHTGAPQKGPMIKIDFALGDFDQHPIALAEDEKDENSSTAGTQSQSSSGAMEQEEEEDSDEEDDGDILNSDRNNVKDSIFRVDK